MPGLWPGITNQHTLLDEGGLPNDISGGRCPINTPYPVEGLGVERVVGSMLAWTHTTAI
ncbi:hypothetical protein [Ktedonobacter sp. SOSP1-85]|uniref:hypothetical protein n=1 Tax=Ktedonobacter sp. SOSP1-85 TaxID=2778367 RepID=UPI0019159730|nr:hypothetical protein [Ktedonobacter sp. SOSP1-85]